MKPRHAYLILAIAGAIVPYWFFVPFLVAHGGLDISAFVQELFGTRISTFFAADLLLSAAVFVQFMGREAERCSIRRPWGVLVPLLTIGLSCALPLFLYIRESHLDAKQPSTETA